jgi:hypothetical protein
MHLEFLDACVTISILLVQVCKELYKYSVLDSKNRTPSVHYIIAKKFYIKSKYSSVYVLHLLLLCCEVSQVRIFSNRLFHKMKERSMNLSPVYGGLYMTGGYGEGYFFPTWVAA